MKLLPLLLTLVVVFSVGNSIEPNSDHQEYLEILFGKTLDVSIVNDIVEEEANVIEITAEEHFNFCFLSQFIYQVARAFDYFSIPSRFFFLELAIGV